MDAKPISNGVFDVVFKEVNPTTGVVLTETHYKANYLTSTPNLLGMTLVLSVTLGDVMIKDYGKLTVAVSTWRTVNRWVQVTYDLNGNFLSAVEFLLVP